MKKPKKPTRTKDLKKRSTGMTTSDFVGLSDVEKERVFQDIEGEDPADRLAQSRPLNARERVRWNRFKKVSGPRKREGS
jgi:hypothetical protein